MAIVEKIDPKDFPGVRVGGGRGPWPSEEMAAVQALQPGEALKFKCRWPHVDSLCKGYNPTYSIARRRGFRVSIICRDKTVYVLRRTK